MDASSNHMPQAESSVTEGKHACTRTWHWYVHSMFMHGYIRKYICTYVNTHSHIIYTPTHAHAHPHQHTRTVHIHARAYTPVHHCRQANIDAYKQTNIHQQTHTHTHTHLLACIPAWVTLRMYAWTHIYISAHSCTFIYTCACTYFIEADNRHNASHGCMAVMSNVRIQRCVCDVNASTNTCAWDNWAHGDP